MSIYVKWSAVLNYVNQVSEPPILMILQTTFDIDIDCVAWPPLPSPCETTALGTCTAFTQAVYSQSALLGLAQRLRVSPCISPAHKAGPRWGKLGVGIPKQCRTRRDCMYRIQSLECLIVAQTNLPCSTKLWAYPVTALVSCSLHLLKVKTFWNQIYDDLWSFFSVCKVQDVLFIFFVMPCNIEM